jgi:preprotein translocase SecE subunit
MKAKVTQLVEDTKNELGKVDWPNRSKVTSLVVVVLIIVMVVSVYVGLLDFVFRLFFKYLGQLT